MTVRNLRMAGATKRKQAEAKLLIYGLQERLLSSIEAFARTLKVHRRTMALLGNSEKKTGRGKIFQTSIMIRARSLTIIRADQAYMRNA
jgi:hypothetical protein